MTYLIIGSGQMAKHMRYYLHSEGHSTLQWNRKIGSQNNSEHDLQELKEYSNIADKTLLLISDSALNPFLDQYPFLRTKNTIHFSGSTLIEGIENIHPLMSFSQNLFAKEFYSKIPFAIFVEEKTNKEKGLEKNLEQIFPGMKNPFFHVNVKDKSLYHAYCVIIGNFSTLLWKTGISNAEKSPLLLNKNLFKPYLEKILENFWANPDSSLTGPLARKDVSTLKSNIDALPEQNIKDLYTQFVKLYSEDLASKLNSN